MKYIVCKRFKCKAICGDVNLPALTECECDDGVIIKHGEKPICSVMSENAHQFFAANHDGMGMVRGRLTQAIQKTLANHDEKYQERWDRVWDDELCQGYRRRDYDDYWLWGHEFFNADIDALRHIAELVGAKEGE